MFVITWKKLDGILPRMLSLYDTWYHSLFYFCDAVTIAKVFEIVLLSKQLCFFCIFYLQKLSFYSY